MNEKPILFSAPMVRGILSGQKTQTRRILKPQPDYRGSAGCESDPDGWGWENDMGNHVPVRFARLRWVVGDRLWVRETLTARPMANFLTDDPTKAIVAAYAADDAGVVESAGFNLAPWWKGGEDKCRSLPSIHMPRWASRITLAVTNVRVERLQAISCADAIAEGIPPAANSMTIDCDTPDPRTEYAALWDHINGPGSWDANPWVAAIEFRREIANAE